MRKRFWTACLVLVLAGCAAPDDGAVLEEEAATAEAVAAGNGDDPCPSLVGSWELVSIASDAPALSQEFDTDPNYQEAPTLKVLNETHWMFIRQSSDQFIHAQGGRYDLNDGQYTETVEYSALPDNIGKSFAFECRLEGDSLWHHVGGLGDNRYNEVWRRVR
jgi:hypothetical protein